METDRAWSITTGNAKCHMCIECGYIQLRCLWSSHWWSQKGCFCIVSLRNEENVLFMQKEFHGAIWILCVGLFFFFPPSLYTILSKCVNSGSIYSWDWGWQFWDTPGYLRSSVALSVKNSSWCSRSPRYVLCATQECPCVITGFINTSAWFCESFPVNPTLLLNHMPNSSLRV